MRTREELLHDIQAHVARVAITPSAVRGQGPPGVAKTARRFLSELPLQQFGVADGSLFGSRLDAVTQALLDRLPAGAASWGLARKLVNIFLRDCLYNGYLRSANALERAEGLLELPLDSITAKALRRECRTLPRWLGVRSLTPAVSNDYQEQAAVVARQEAVARVHLDAIWWGVRE